MKKSYHVKITAGKGLLAKYKGDSAGGSKDLVVMETFANEPIQKSLKRVLRVV